MKKPWASALLTALLTLMLTRIAGAQVDLNKATEMELDGVKGLGPAMTRQLMREREKAPFRDWPDVMQRVKGLGPQKAAQLSAQGVQVQGQEHGPSPHPKP